MIKGAGVFSRFFSISLLAPFTSHHFDYTEITGANYGTRL